MEWKCLTSLKSSLSSCLVFLPVIFLHTYSLFSPSPLNFAFPRTEESFLALFLKSLFLMTPLSAQALSKSTTLFQSNTNSSKSAKKKKSSCFAVTSTLQWLLLVVSRRWGREESQAQSSKWCETSFKFAPCTTLITITRRHVCAKGADHTQYHVQHSVLIVLWC